MSVKISTWNVKGSNNKDLIHIPFLQETPDDEHKKYCREWVGQIFFTSYSTNKRGVITLIHKNLPFTVIYAPNAQDDEFYTILFSQLVDMDCANIILAGDFNCVLCPKMDKLPPQFTLTKNSKALWQIVNELDLVDVWRHYNPLCKEYTFHSNPHLSASCIDYIFMSKCISQLVQQVNIGHIGLSDHTPVKLSFVLLRFLTFIDFNSYGLRYITTISVTVSFSSCGVMHFYRRLSSFF
uniref:exodeoxyribonuclease III n=1 Tax=Pundamilia nyererei TaxID=303518 RepID=A0A3B4EU41_9CICH